MRIPLFVFGDLDYDFLLKLYGISDAQGTHPCIFCTISKAQLQVPPFFNHRNITQRSLDNITIRRDNKRYPWHSNKKITKLHNNAIRSPIVDIELDHVAPPYLQILLGIAKKHHDLLEEE